MWTQTEAIALCAQLEIFAPEFGCHVALTGGCLYKSGDRKDLDIVLYRIRQEPFIDVDGFFERAEKIGVNMLADHGFVIKATLCEYDEYRRCRERSIDFLLPERGEDDDNYPPKHT